MYDILYSDGDRESGVAAELIRPRNAPSAIGGSVDSQLAPAASPVLRVFASVYTPAWSIALEDDLRRVDRAQLGSVSPFELFDMLRDRGLRLTQDDQGELRRMFG